MKNEAEPVPRERVSITLPKKCVEWIDKQIEARKFFSRSHAVEVLILEKMREKRTSP